MSARHPNVALRDRFANDKAVPTDLDGALTNPGLPRGTHVADRTHPDTVDKRTPYPRRDELTPLQKHVSYFDRNKDGIIHIHETVAGFRALGFNTLIALSSALAFHLLHVSYPTSPSWLPDPRFPVHVANIHWAKHGSDTETFDTEGRFVPQKFEEIFSKYDSDGKGGLYFSDVVTMWRGNRNVLDVVGWVFQVFLWGFLFILAARPGEAGGAGRRYLHKDDVLKQYDGTLYYEIEERRRKGDRLPWYMGGLIFGVL